MDRDYYSKVKRVTTCENKIKLERSSDECGFIVERVTTFNKVYTPEVIYLYMINTVSSMHYSLSVGFVMLLLIYCEYNWGLVVTWVYIIPSM